MKMLPINELALLLTSSLLLSGCDADKDKSGAPNGSDDQSSDSDVDTDSDADSDGDTDENRETDAPDSWPDDKYISVDEVYARSQADDPEMLLVNVVDTEYYNLGHIADSLKIPWDTLEGRLDELDPTRHIVVYCRKGVRSETAYTTLEDNDFPLVWVMEGGIEAWIAKGYPTVAE